MKVKDIMQTKLTKIRSDISVSDAIEIMVQEKVGSLLVENKGEVISIFTQGDIIVKVLGEKKDPDDVFVKEVSSDNMIMVDEEADIIEASELLAKYNIRRLVVTKNGKVIGIISSKVIGNQLHSIIKAYLH